MRAIFAASKYRRFPKKILKILDFENYANYAKFSNFYKKLSGFFSKLCLDYANYANVMPSGSKLCELCQILFGIIFEKKLCNLLSNYAKKWQFGIIMPNLATLYATHFQIMPKNDNLA